MLTKSTNAGYTDEVSHDILIYWQQKADVWPQLSSVARGLLGVPAGVPRLRGPSR